MNKSKEFNNIVEESARGELIFPTNVHTSLKLQQALDDPNCGIETAAKLVLTEPMLSARVVAIANSVAYSRFGGGVTNVKTAVTILGFSTLRSIVATVIIRQLSHAITDPALRRMANQLWEHSAHVAALAHVIARRVSQVDSDTALFAGIVHEVGGFYLLSRAQEFPVLLEDIRNVPQDTEDGADSPEAIIGRAVLNKLMVPKTVITAVEALWYGMRIMPPVTLGETLLLANDLAAVASPLDPRSASDIKQDASAIDFAVGNDSLKDVLIESEQEARSLRNALTT
jgi:HD-like signal output (HDOD) protein